MTDDLDPTPSVTEPEKTRWGRGPLIIAFVFPLFFAVLAFAVLGYGLIKDAQEKRLATDAPPVAAPAPALPDKDAEIARLTAELNQLRSQMAAQPVEPAYAPPAYAPPAYDADPAAITRLSERLDRLEANQRLMIQAATAATAAAGLQQAIKGSQPFLPELTDVERTLTDHSLVAPLRPLAQSGVPSEVALAIEFPAWAARAQAAARTSEDTSFLGRIGNAFNALISVRRVDSGATGTDALWLQAQARLDQGDLDGALSVLSTLPASAQAAIKPWLDKAQSRVLVDTTTRRITLETLTRLSQANAATPVAENVL